MWQQWYFRFFFTIGALYCQQSESALTSVRPRLTRHRCPDNVGRLRWSSALAVYTLYACELLSSPASEAEPVTSGDVTLRPFAEFATSSDVWIGHNSEPLFMRTRKQQNTVS